MSSKDRIDMLPEWSALTKHAQETKHTHIKELFKGDTARFEDFNVRLDGMVFDYSKHAVSTQTMSLLLDLAKVRGIETMRDAMAAGEHINTSEDRAVLHMALRHSLSEGVKDGGEDVSDFVDSSLNHMVEICDKIRSDNHITDIVNIGIGGSDLGSKMVYHALRPLAKGPDVHFVSNIDGQAIIECLKPLDPKKTIIIITSKTFTTLETLANAETAKSWLMGAIEPEKLSEHLFAVTSASEKAMEFGVPANHILLMRNWIGGRFSLWSCVGLSLCIAFGGEVFNQLLEGARDADKHFMDAPLEDNIPVIMGLLGVWYRNFKAYTSHAILPYHHGLRYLPLYLQQLDMESNGKSVNKYGEAVGVATGPVIFGEAGTNAQHTFMQLMHQSEEIIPADFIISAKPLHDLSHHHVQLVTNALAQSRALMEGRNNTEEPQRHFPGNRPSSTFMFEKLDAYHLGMLIAFYEHKTFVQGVIWGINSFDQWGVELGKSLAKELSETLSDKRELPETLDSSTAALMRYYRDHSGK